MRERADPARALVAATHEVAVAVLRVGFGLMTAAAASDTLFAAATGADASTVGVGAVLTGCASVGLAHPEPASRLLRGNGRVLLPVGLFAAIGALDAAVQSHYPEVASAIIWISVVVSSARLVAGYVALSAGGYVADFAIHGHSLTWILHGPGQVVIANELVELVANAGVMLLLISILRRFLASAPAQIAEVRAGGPSLTPQLAIAARQPPSALPRADPRALVAGFTLAERRVLALLMAGRAPKQAARDLDLSVATVRTQIAAAKRKSGARTLEQLVAIFAEAGPDA